ncbi:MAG: hypothetical protein WAW79_02690 [Steroidobacteraceae bacterium]
MKKLFLGVAMLLTGLLGLSMSFCGLVFLLDSGIGLLGLIPGVLLLWAARSMWKAYKRSDTT